MPELAVQQKVGPYLLLREAGQGGMAIVYEALDERTCQTVAVKLLKSSLLSSRHQAEALAQLDREAETLSGLSHPNIVALRQGHRSETSPPNDLHYIVLEYLDGMNLRTRLGQDRLQPGAIFSILEQVAEGLDALHAAGLAYGDLKPSNIMVLRDGAVKLIDFGMSRPKRARAGTRGEPLVGSPAYLAPELIRGGPVSPAADLWAMGVLLYEMLTGNLPFSGIAIPEVLSKIRHEAPAPLPPAHAAVDRVLRQALDKNPKRRFPSAQALVAAYAAAAGLCSCWADTQVIERPARRPCPRWAAAGAALAACLAVAALYHYVHPTPPPTPVPPPSVRVAGFRQERRRSLYHRRPAHRSRPSAEEVTRPLAHRRVRITEAAPALTPDLPRDTGKDTNI